MAGWNGLGYKTVQGLLITGLLLCTPAVIGRLFADGDDPADKAAPPDDSIHIMVDGVLMESGDKPLIENGRVMIPLRAVVEYLNGKINWYPDERQVIGFRGAKGFDLIIGADRASLSDGTSYKLDVPAMIIAGRTYVPLRFVSEAMGCRVEWDDTVRTARIATSVVDTKKEVEEFATPILLQVITDEGAYSGFFYSKEGHIITFAHAVRDAAWIRIKTAAGTEYQAELMILDSVTSLAKLRVVRAQGETFPVFRYFDDFRGVEDGEGIFALGSPWLINKPVELGRISAKISGDDREDGLNTYQVTAAITTEYCGGPLVKENGALIGVICQGPDEGKVYAIPIEYVFNMRNR